MDMKQQVFYVERMLHAEEIHCRSTCSFQATFLVQYVTPVYGGIYKDYLLRKSSMFGDTAAVQVINTLESSSHSN